MMKNKNLLIGLCSVPLLLSISTNMTAQRRARIPHLRNRSMRYFPNKKKNKATTAIMATAFDK